MFRLLVERRRARANSRTRQRASAWRRVNRHRTDKKGSHSAEGFVKSVVVNVIEPSRTGSVTLVTDGSLASLLFFACFMPLGSEENMECPKEFR